MAIIKQPKYLDELLALAVEAGRATLPYFNKHEKLVETKKEDNTPVTAADLCSDEVIRNGLQGLFPDDPVLTEETVKEHDWEQRQAWDTYWLIDPLDGTRGFLLGDPNYTINIALIQNHAPIIGIIYLPVLDQLYWGVKSGGSYSQQGLAGDPEVLKTRTLNDRAVEAVTGCFTDGAQYFDHLEANPDFMFAPVNSSYKICLIAEGGKDLYPKFSHISEWDTAAGQVILEEAGGCLVDSKGVSLRYNRTNSLLNPRFIALGDKQQEQQMLALVFDQEKLKKGERQ